MKPDISRPFAVFDIDGTLIRWQLFHAIVHHLGQQGYILRHHHDAIRAARLRWKNRETAEGFRAYEKVLVEVYAEVLTHIHPDDHRRIVDEVVSEYKDQTYVYTRDLVRKLKAEGYLLFAVSGSHEDAVGRVAQHHGFDAWVGARFDERDKSFTGDYYSPIFDKKAALQKLVEEHGATFENSYAVGDSGSDVVMLEMVENPIAFNPDARLCEIAKRHNWPIVIERKNVSYRLEYTGKGYSLIER